MFDWMEDFIKTLYWVVGILFLLVVVLTGVVIYQVVT